MKKSILALAGIFIVSCGGTSGEGSKSKGFYTLSFSITPSYLVSPAVDDSSGEPIIPPDEITVNLSLFYEGTGVPLKGYVKKAKLCLETGDCVNLPVGGVIEGGNTISTTVKFKAHKYGVPWIVLNPYEDEIFATEKISDTLKGGVKTSVYQDSYYNAERRVILPDYPLVPKSVALTTQNSSFEYSLTVYGYETTDGTVNLKLPKGYLSANRVIANSLRIDAGSIVCIDDGAGNIVDEGGGNNCSGSINYDTGDLSFQVLNVTTPTDVVISYNFEGQLYCYDDGEGKLSGDCTDTSSVDYQNSEITYKFRYNATNLPLPLDISYSFYEGTVDGKTFYYLLPSDTVDSRNPNKKYIYGRDITVYKNGNFACSLNNPLQCEITKEGRSVSIVFQNPQQNATLTIEYTKDTVYDFNPKVDAKRYNHLWNGSSSAIVNGNVEVETELEDGTVMKVSQKITLEIVPKSGGLQ